MTRVLRLLATVALGATCSCGEETVVAVSPKLVLSEPIDFRAVSAGGRATLAVRATNAGTATLEVTVEGITADTPFEVERRSYLVAPNATIDIDVTFAPLVPRNEPWVGELVVTSNDRERAEAAVGVRGVAVLQVLAFEPDPLQVGPVLVQTTWRGTIAVTNTTQDDRVLAARVTGNFNGIIHERGEGRFSIDGPLKEPGASVPIAAGETVDVPLLYDAPNVAEMTTARLDFTSCGGAECIDQMTMLATVTDAPFVCEPAELNFGFVDPNVIKATTSTCTNVADRPVGVDDVAVQLGGSTFVRTSPIPAARIDPGASFSITVEATAPASLLGQPISTTTLVVPRREGALRLEPTVVPIVARVGRPRIVMSPTFLGMGPVVVGTTAQRDIVLFNEGEWSVELTASATGDDTFVVDAAPFLLGPGEFFRLGIDFTPTRAQAYDATIRLRATGPVDDLVVFASGEGLDLPPCGQISVFSEIEVGLVQVHRPKTIPIRITNRGSSDCVLGAPYLDPAGDEAFTLPRTPASMILAPGDATIVDVNFAPTAIREAQAGLRFYVSVPSDERRVVSLIGEGVTDALLVAPSALAFGGVDPSCQSTDIRVAVHNPIGPDRQIDRLEVITEANAFVATSLPSTDAIVEGANQSFGIGYRPNGPIAETAQVRVFERGRARPYVVFARGFGTTDSTVERHRRATRPKIDVLVVLPPASVALGQDLQYGARMRSLFVGLEATGADYQIVALHPQLRWPNGSPCTYAPDRPSGLDEGRCAYFQEGGLTGPAMVDWRIIRSGTSPDPLTAFQRMVLPQGNSNDAFETIFRALSPPLEQGWNAGFLRPDAHLAVVLVSGSDDESVGWVPRELGLYVDFIRNTKGHLPNNRVSISAVSIDNASCGGPVVTPRIISAAAKLGGVVVPGCGGSDWGAAIADAGLSLIGNRTRFELTHVPDTNGVTVQIDGRPITAWTFDATNNTVDFDPNAAPSADEETVFSYRPACP